MAHKIFTAEAGRVTEGAAVYPKIVADYTINVIEVGESGRGRRVDSVLAEFADGSPARPEGDILAAANVTQTRSGKTKLVAIKADESEETDDSKAIVVLRSPIGFRGGNNHTGDRAPDYSSENPTFLDFPGQILAHGTIAQGTAGAMGSGSQYIILVERGVWFRLSMSGRLYNRPNVYYYRFDGTKLVALTADERTELDLW